MSVETDTENARAALAVCKSFAGRKLASGHSIIVGAGSEMPGLGAQKHDSPLLMSLAIEDVRCDDPIALFAVNCFGGQFQIYFLRNRSIASHAFNTIDELREALDDLLADVDAVQVVEAIAEWRGQLD